MKIEPHLEAMLPQIELRVLYGPQSGSRLALAPGDYLLGSGDDCAVMLAGPRIRECHATLSFDGEQPSITPVDGEIVDAQGNELHDTVPLTLGMPFELGGIWISVDSIDAPWPDPDAIVGMAGLAPPPPAATAPEAPASAAPVPGTTPAPPAHRRARIVLVASMSVIVGVAVAAVGLSAWLVRRGATQTPSVARPAVTSESAEVRALRSMLAGMPPGLVVNLGTDADGTPKLTGYVPDRATATKVQNAVRKLSARALVQLQVDTDLLEAVRKVVAKQNAPTRAIVTVSEVRNGNVTLSGAVSNTAVRENMLDAIRSEVPRISGIGGNLYTVEDLSGVLQDRINAAGLASRLKVTDRQPEFVLNGRLNEAEMMRWESLLLAFTADYGSLLPIRATIVVQQRKPPVNVQMIVGGDMPFIVTDNGQHIGRGGDANGHTLSAVRDNEVVFDGNERFRIPR